MTVKHLLFESAARDAVLRGAAAMANAVKVTLGPKSKCVLIERRWDRPIVCNDGVTIAKEFDLKDPEENLGAQVLRQAAERTGDVVGDGTSTSTILAHAMLADGIRNVVAGASAIDLKRGLDRGMRAATDMGGFYMRAAVALCRSSTSGRLRRRLGSAALSALFALFPLRSPAADAQPSLDEMALEQLMEMKVGTVYGASLYAQKTSEAPSSVTIITAEEIKRFGWRTIAEVLSAVRSFWMTEDRVYSFVGVRGMQRPGDYNSRVLVQLDGHSTNDNLYGGASFGHDAIVDLALVDRIEIIRGPGSALYGTNAFYAVVNLVTRTGASVKGVEAQASGGSSAPRLGSPLGGARTAGGVDVFAMTSGFTSRGPDLFFPEFDSPERTLPAARTWSPRPY